MPFIRLLKSLFLFGVVFSCSTQLSVAEEKNNNKSQLEDLLYKNTLYHYYSGDYISALTRILVNEKRLLANTEAERTKILQEMLSGITWVMISMIILIIKMRLIRWRE